MPARDGTGPFGTGPVGRRLGPGGGNEPVYDQPFGMGMAYRRGRRFGNRGPRWGWRGFPVERDEEGEIQDLRQRQSWLKEQLDAVTRALESRNRPVE